MCVLCGVYMCMNSCVCTEHICQENSLLRLCRTTRTFDVDGVFFFIKWWIVHFSMAVSFVDVHVAHALVKKGAVVLSEVGVPFNILFFFLPCWYPAPHYHIPDVENKTFLETLNVCGWERKDESWRRGNNHPGLFLMCDVTFAKSREMALENGQNCGWHK